MRKCSWARLQVKSSQVKSTITSLRSTFDRLPYGCLLFMYRLVVFAFKTLQEPGTCHPRSEEVAQVAVVVVVFPVVVLCRGEHRSQWARLSRASRQIKHHKASSRHCSPSVNESGEQGSKASVSLLERRVRERTLLQASVRREACPSWAAEPACRRTLSERGAGAAGLGTRVGPERPMTR